MNVRGVGIDVVDLARFRRLTRHERLIRRWFTPAERRTCDGAAQPVLRYAQVFASKEAVFKALAVPDWDGSVPWRWIDVVLGPRVGGFATLSGPLALAAGRGIRLTVEVSATPVAALARAIAFTRPG